MKNLEDQLQIACADYLRWKHPDLLWWHTANEWFSGARNPAKGQKYKSMGLKAGVPDIFIPKSDLKLDCLARYHYGFFCELKVKPNKVKKGSEQEKVINQLRDLGYYVCVCYTLDEFIKEVETYLGE